MAVVGQAGYCYQDGRTVATSTDVELRYSPWCRTAWARWTGGGGYLTGVLIRSYAADGSLRKTYYDNGTSGDWSFMVNDKGMTAQACWYYYDDETMTTRHVRNCTAKY
ncbi:DUF2690 domain-containing protein [Micromonospora sp. NPDC000729]|uniref:DUF2690 domain-containing protein n=1 Tax=Micromonospora sp. NPDC000729 TaxID=3364220 RepID=UPI0036C6C475